LGTALQTAFQAFLPVISGLSTDVPLDYDGNGIPDNAHPALADAVLNDPTAPNHCCAREAFLNNIVLLQREAKVASIPVGGGSGTDVLPSVLLVAAGYLTLGEPAGIALAQQVLGNFGVTICPDDVDISARVYLGADGDMDLDGICNRGEFSIQDADPVTAFVQRALNSNQAWNYGGCDRGCVSVATRWATADQNHDGKINLSELLRVIQFFNAHTFHCQAGTEDGYAPYAGDTSCAAYTSDYNPQNWKISLSELLRTIQFFNSHAYHFCPDEGTEDGFCTGPA
jgi:hypothetical protein